MLRYDGSARSSSSSRMSASGADLPGDGNWNLSAPRGEASRAAWHDNPLIARLQGVEVLDEKDISALVRLTGQPKRALANCNLFYEGCSSDHVCVLLAGVACRYRMLTGGRRQILGFVLPGDVCDVDFITHGPPDHSVTLLTNSVVVKVPRAQMLELLQSRPAIMRAIARLSRIDRAILREWLLNIGQRSASERLSHFLCEIATRLASVGQVDAEGSHPFGINQVALADTLGLSTVHLNRVLQRLRTDGLISLRQRRLKILDHARLAAHAGFDVSYLSTRIDIF